jgi:hypothetical protein
MLQFWTTLLCLPLLEIASVLMRLDHVASFIVNADHGIVSIKQRRTRAQSRLEMRM